MAWLFLIGAIGSEVGGTLALRMANHGTKRWYFVVAPAYVIAFFLLAQGLEKGLALGVAYGIWVAAGVALTALLSRLLFREALNGIMTLGIACIIGGVMLIELGVAH